MSNLSLYTETVHGRSAYTLTNGRLRISALTGGGHLVDLRLISRDPALAISPFYVPTYPTIDPHTYDPAHHSARYGAGENARLLAGYMGHLPLAHRPRRRLGMALPFTAKRSRLNGCNSSHPRSATKPSPFPMALTCRPCNIGLKEQ